MKNIIYYFTGTGNSYYVSKKISQAIGETELVSIATALKEDKLQCTGDKVGIVFPLYCAGLPEIVLRFIRKLKVNDNAYIFAICTRGISTGQAMSQIDKVLKEKGNKLSYNFYITMPDNYIKAVKMKNEEESKKIIKKADKKIQEVIVDIKEEKNKKASQGIVGTITKPVYNSFMKNINYQDKDFYADDKCINCGLCEKICPVDNIELVEGKPQWKHHCQSCMACIQYCPSISIQIAHKTENKIRYKNPYVTLKEILK